MVGAPGARLGRGRARGWGAPQRLGVLTTSTASRPWSHVLPPGDTLSLELEGHAYPQGRQQSPPPVRGCSPRRGKHPLFTCDSNVASFREADGPHATSWSAFFQKERPLSKGTWRRETSCPSISRGACLVSWRGPAVQPFVFVLLH